MICDPHFEPLIAGYLPEVLSTSEDTIYGLWPDLTLAYVNQGWTQFASENGGGSEISRNWSIGRNIRDAIPPDLKPVFEQGYSKCLNENRPWEHEYECSSAEQHRRFLMRAYPLKDSQGLLIVNSTIYQGRHTEEPHEPVERDYLTADGLIIQCCHCRRVRRVASYKAWDWVPKWVVHCPPYTSHGICEPCYGFFYGSKRHSRTQSS